MDPNANLEEQVALARNIVATETDDGIFENECARLAELVLALDEWRRKGGFDPYDNVRRSIENV